MGLKFSEIFVVRLAPIILTHLEADDAATTVAYRQNVTSAVKRNG